MKYAVENKITLGRGVQVMSDGDFFAQYQLFQTSKNDIVILTIFNNTGYTIDVVIANEKKLSFQDHKPSITEVLPLSKDDVKFIRKQVRRLINFKNNL